ncbi:hypothetical protein COO60DRAFT_575490 [Scenedesmus sp. NREL 46B-D3]|nr:hypothetical protein COO60DRAFT_575490 [Scenedesmus sp. NREL 46B-D3]
MQQAASALQLAGNGPCCYLEQDSRHQGLPGLPASETGAAIIFHFCWSCYCCKLCCSSAQRQHRPFQLHSRSRPAMLRASCRSAKASRCSLVTSCISGAAAAVAAACAVLAGGHELPTVKLALALSFCAALSMLSCKPVTASVAPLSAAGLQELVVAGSIFALTTAIACLVAAFSVLLRGTLAARADNGSQVHPHCCANASASAQAQLPALLPLLVVPGASAAAAGSASTPAFAVASAAHGGGCHPFLLFDLTGR